MGAITQPIAVLCRYKRPLPPPDRVAPTTTLEQDWLAAIERERLAERKLKPDGQNYNADPEVATFTTFTTDSPKLKIPPKTKALRGSFTPSSAAVVTSSKMSPAATTATHPSSSAIRLQLDIKKSREGIQHFSRGFFNDDWLATFF